MKLLIILVFLTKDIVVAENIFYVEMEVSSNAMEEAGIRYGDRIRVQRNSDCKDGQVVIACLNGQMLLRMFKKTGYSIQLVPATRNLSPIEVDTRACDFEVWGVVTHVIRKL